MLTIDEAKAMAKRLRSALGERETIVSHANSLELVAATIGHRDWIRIFDVSKAREFYCDFLGFTVIMEHRFEPDLPLYMAVERAGLELHLSEHHGDGTPGSTSYVAMRDIAKFHAELISRKYGYGRSSASLGEIRWG